MKLLSDREYFELLEFKNQVNSSQSQISQLKNLTQNLEDANKIKLEFDEILSRINKNISHLFWEHCNKDEDNNFNHFIFNLSDFIQEVLSLSASIFGFEKNGIFTDLRISLSENFRVNENHFTGFQRVLKEESFIGNFFDENQNYFVWDSTVDYKLNNIIFWKKNYPNKIPNRRIIERLTHYFDIPEVSNILIFPIFNYTQERKLVGYFILINTKNSFLKLMPKLFESIAPNLSLIYNYFSYQRQFVADNVFISELYTQYFNTGLDQIMEYLSNILPTNLISFWTPTLDETERCYILNKSYSNVFSKDEVSKINKKSIYNLNNESTPKSIEIIKYKYRIKNGHML